MILPDFPFQQVVVPWLRRIARWDWRWRLRGRPMYGPALQQLAREAPRWLREMGKPPSRPTGRRILLFATHDRWIYLNALMALTLAGRKHRVALAFLPYPNWMRPFRTYALWQREVAYAEVLARLQPWVQPLSLLREPRAPLPPELKNAVEQTTHFDMQYTLQQESVPPTHPLWALRQRRNRDAAARLLHLFRRWKPHLVITPNGLILEFAMAYQVARYLGIPVITYEFDEQREHAWMVRNAVVMHLPLEPLWARYREQPLTPEEQARIRRAMEDRWQGRVWERSERQWQAVPPQGSRRVARNLGLDPHRPLFLLAPNVFGDSVVLGREVFSQGMTEWVQRTISFFLAHPEAQLIIRVHPGEKALGPQGLSMAAVAREALRGHSGENIRIIEASARINTFDLVPLATAGLVYTSTIGLEMALQGLPVVVAGRAFYRNKGFTLDPTTWAEYFALLERLLQDPASLRPTPAQQELAWRFAYTFFYRFPKPFPWHLHHVTEQTQQGRTPAWALAQSIYETTWHWLEDASI